jgi:hypothetical protein
VTNNNITATFTNIARHLTAEYTMTEGHSSSEVPQIKSKAKLENILRFLKKRQQVDSSQRGLICFWHPVDQMNS